LRQFDTNHKGVLDDLLSGKKKKMKLGALSTGGLRRKDIGRGGELKEKKKNMTLGETSLPLGQ